MMPPKITAIAPYAGAKRTLAPRIVELLGEHDAYYEPFAGSMAVLFAKEPAPLELVNDLNDDLVNVALAVRIRHTRARLLMRLDDTIFHERLFRRSADKMSGSFRLPCDLDGDAHPDIDRAYHALVCWWLGRNGFAGTTRPGGFAARYSGNGGSPAVRWRSLVESVPWFRHRLRNVTVTCRDGFEVLARVPDRAGAVVYADPPYLQKSFEYRHDFKPEEHARLAVSLGRFRHTRVVVSYYPHESLDGLYPPGRWRRVEVAVQKKAANAVRGNARKVEATELLLVNDAGRWPDLAAINHTEE